MSEEQHIALPRLYGASAYSRPPRPVQELVRPFDPDELPLEADRTSGDAVLTSELAGASWTPAAAPLPKPRGGRRGRAAKPVGDATGANPAGGGPDRDAAPAGLQGRPFRLRGLGRIFGGDRQ